MQFANHTIREQLVDAPDSPGAQHYCRHFKEERVFQELPNSFPATVPGGYVTFLSPCPSWYSSAFSKDPWKHEPADPYYWRTPRMSVSWGSKNISSTYAALCQRAASSGADWLLNAVESPEIPESIRSFSNYFGRFKGGVWSKARKTLRKTALWAGGSFLAYEFGVAPLIHDIKTTHRKLQRLENDFRRFHERRTRRLSSTDFGTFEFDDTPSSTDPPSGGSTTRVTYQAGCHTWPHTKYTLVYKDNNPYSTALFERLSFLVNRFGSNGPVDFAWELIPFSFVIDWFVDTGVLIQKLNTLVGYSPINVEAFWGTKFCEAWVLVDKQAYRTDTWTPLYGGSTRWYERAYRMYERNLIHSKGSNVPLENRFGKKQGLESVALLLQRIL